MRYFMADYDVEKFKRMWVDKRMVEQWKYVKLK